MAVTRKKKGLNRKQLKQPDEIQSFLGKLLDFYDFHRKEVWFGFAGIILTAIIVWGVIYTNNKKYDRYHYLINKEIDKYNKWVTGDQKDKIQLEEITKKFQQLSDGAPGKLKTLALFYTALGFYRQNKFDPAATILTQIKDKPDDEGFKSLIYYNLYKTYASMHRYKEAMQVINEALDKLYANPYEDFMRRDLERYKKFVSWQNRLQQLFQKQKNIKFPQKVTGK